MVAVALPDDLYIEGTQRFSAHISKPQGGEIGVE